MATHGTELVLSIYSIDLHQHELAYLEAIKKKLSVIKGSTVTIIYLEFS